MRAAVLLARAWARDARGWWVASWLTLSAAGLVVLGVLGVFAGLERETDERVAAFFTGDARVVVGPPGAAKAQPFEGNGSDVQDALRQLGAPHASLRLESQFILSRRTLLELLTDEDETYEVAAPGTDPKADALGLGILIGVDTADRTAVAGMEAALASGRLPQPTQGRVVELAVSDDLLRRFMSPEEREAIGTWPPTAEQVAHVRFEVTAARVDEGGPFRDVLRRPGRIVGIYHTGLQVLDSFTAVTDIASVRELTAAGPEAANAVTLHGPVPAGLGERAGAHGWSVEGPAPFAGRYLGQVVELVRWLAAVAAGSLLLLPTVLVWNGLQQMLDRQRREVAVCRAIGVDAATLRSALGLLVGGLGIAASAAIAAFALLGGPMADRLLQGWDDGPFPLGFGVTAPAALGVAAGMLAALAAAYAMAWRKQARQDLATALRSP